MLSFSLSLNSTPAWAQDKAPDKTEKKDEAEIPPPEEIDLKTDDGVVLKVTYFAGTHGKESIPVILLHGAKGNRKGFITQEQGVALAPYLQEKLGCAVLAIDLRGHGESTTRIKENKTKEPIKAEKLRPTDISAMVTQDLRAVKDFLWKKNNEGVLNIDKLAVVGVDMGAALALSYTAYDANGYEEQQAKYGPLKLGKFVKAVVLISPVNNITGLKTAQVMRLPEVCGVPVMIAVGNKGKKSFADADHLYSLFVKGRPPTAGGKSELKTVYFFSKLDTSLQGSELLAEPSLKVASNTVEFLKIILVKNPDAKEEWVWKERKRPHE